jgi:hypothetical protein
VLFRDFADPRFLEDVTGKPRSAASTAADDSR